MHGSVCGIGRRALYRTPTRLVRHNGSGQLFHDLEAEIPEQHPKHDGQERGLRVDQGADFIGTRSRICLDAHLVNAWDGKERDLMMSSRLHVSAAINHR